MLSSRWQREEAMRGVFEFFSSLMNASVWLHAIFAILLGWAVSVHSNESPSNLVQELRDGEFSYTSVHQFARGSHLSLSTEAPSALENNAEEIPKIIWTYWNNDNLPDFIERCIANWRFFNPGYQIFVVTPSNLDQFIRSEPPKYFGGSAFTPQFQSDWVRMELLALYGGIWMDASTVLLGSLDWVHRMQQFEQKDGLIFYVDHMTHDFNRPVVENWFIASVPGGQFVKNWRKEYTWALDHFTNGFEYANYLRQKYGKRIVDFMLQGMNTEGRCRYLMQHVTALRLMFIDEIDMNFVLLRAEDGPMHLLGTDDLRPSTIEQYVLKWTRVPMMEWKELTELQVPMIKLIGQHRHVLLNRVEMDTKSGNVHSHSLYAQVVDKAASNNFMPPTWRYNLKRRLKNFTAHLKRFFRWFRWN